MWLKEPRRWQDRESGSTCSRQLGPRVAPAGGEPPGGRQRAAPSEGTHPLYHVQGCRRRVIEYVGGRWSRSSRDGQRAAHCGSGSFRVSGSSRSSSAPPPASTAPTIRLGPKPAAPVRCPTSCRPSAPPTAPATAVTVSDVARARVGKSSPYHAATTGAEALASTLQTTFPTQYVWVVPTNVSAPNAAVASCSPGASRRRPQRSESRAPIGNAGSESAPETTITADRSVGVMPSRLPKSTTSRP